MTTPGFRINPKYRAYGKARIDLARRIRTQEDWERLWKEPAHTFPFEWDRNWKSGVEYRVEDYAAEIGFFIDVLGFIVEAFGTDYAMFTSPQGDFHFAVTPTQPGQSATPPYAFRLQFTIADILSSVDDLVRRGVTFEQAPMPCQPGSSMYTATFRTPNGIPIDLMGELPEDVDEEETGEPENEEEIEDEDNEADEDEF